MIKKMLGTWKFDSGNACHATLELTRPSQVAVSFAWKSSMTEEDRDQYACIVLPEALRLAVQEVEALADITVTLRELESDGIIARVGVRDGDTVWALTEKGQEMEAMPRKSLLGDLPSKIQRMQLPHWRGVLRPRV